MKKTWIIKIKFSFPGGLPRPMCRGKGLGDGVDGFGQFDGEAKNGSIKPMKDVNGAKFKENGEEKGIIKLWKMSLVRK
jgi:hypothetical protein